MRVRGEQELDGPPALEYSHHLTEPHLELERRTPGP